MRIIKWMLLGVVVLAVLVELAVPRFAAARIEAGVRERVRDAAGIDARLGDFPVVTRYLVTGKVDEVRVVLRDVVRQEVPFTRVRFDLDGVSLDRAALVRGEVEVTDMDTGRVTAQIDTSDLGPAGEQIPDRVDVAGRQLRLGEAVRVAIPDELVPCPPRAEVEPGQVVLTCTLDQVPSILVRAVG
ncbi:MAG: DUF2993 domain-containing protein [Actinobacteria bacterium]|nr:DUF2993 domain-containing protein [Actinomycetota bacterium]